MSVEIDDDAVSAAVDAFEAAWRQGGPPQIRSFLCAAEAPYFPLLLRELISADQDHRLARKQLQKKIEEYLADWKHFLADDEFVCKLLRSECLTRASYGDMPEPEEIPARFPHLTAHIDLPGIASEAGTDHAEPQHAFETVAGRTQSSTAPPV